MPNAARRPLVLYPAALRGWSLAVLALGVLAAPGASAQEEPEPANAPVEQAGPRKKPPPVRMEVQVGQRVLRDDFAREGKTVPIRVVLDNTGAPIVGRIEIRDARGRAVSEMAVELPQPSHKEYTLFAALEQGDQDSNYSAGSIRLFDGRRMAASKPLIFRSLATNVLVLSATGDGSGLQFMGEGKRYDYPDQDRTYRAAHISPQDLPRQWPGYEPADVVALNGRAWTQMDDEQKRAFRMWVEQGGRAIICGESTTEWRDREGAALCPIVPRELHSLKQLACLGRWGGAPFRTASGGLMLASGPLAPGGEVLLSEGGIPVVLARPTLRGSVVWIGFDGFRDTVRNWPGFVRFWHRAVDETIRRVPPDRLLRLREVKEAGAAASSLPRLPAPPMGAVVAFGVMYGLIFGPLNIFVLRRLRRTVRSWLFMPALAVGMTVVVLFVGQLWGSARTVLNSFSVLQAQSGGRTAYEESLIGLFSPTNRDFDLTLDDPAPALIDLGSVERRPGEAAAPPRAFGWPEHQLDGAVRWDRVPLALFSTKMLEQRRPRDLEGSFEIDVDSAGGGAVRNKSSFPLRRAYLRRRGRYHWIGDLTRGASAVVKSAKWGAGLPKPSAAAPVGELRENATYRRNMETLWRSAGDVLMPAESQGDVWLIGEVERYRGGLDVSGVPYSNRAALLMVRLPWKAGR